MWVFICNPPPGLQMLRAGLTKGIKVTKINLLIVGGIFRNITIMGRVGFHVFKPQRTNAQCCNFAGIYFCLNFVHISPSRISSGGNLEYLTIRTENSPALPGSPCWKYMPRVGLSLLYFLPQTGAGVAQGKPRYRGGTRLGPKVPKQNLRGISIRDAAWGSGVLRISAKVRGWGDAPPRVLL